VSRETFIAALRNGLEGLPADAVADIVWDYEGHIAEALSRGRSEGDVLAALGDPVRIARELRAEIRVTSWRVKHGPAAAFHAIAALVGLGAVDFILIAPPLAIVVAVLLAIVLTALGMIGSGALLLFAAMGDAFTDTLRELFAVAAANVSGSALLALALAAGAVAGLAASLLLAIAVVNITVWYGRLHYRLIRPPSRQATEHQSKKLTVIES
jgi:uncharacterized membrane protein